MRLARALEYGMVAIDREEITGGPILFGGWKQVRSCPRGLAPRHGGITELEHLWIYTAA